MDDPFLWYSSTTRCIHFSSPTLQLRIESTVRHLRAMAKVSKCCSQMKPMPWNIESKWVLAFPNAAFFIPQKDASDVCVLAHLVLHTETLTLCHWALLCRLYPLRDWCPRTATNQMNDAIYNVLLKCILLRNFGFLAPSVQFDPYPNVKWIQREIKKIFTKWNPNNDCTSLDCNAQGTWVKRFILKTQERGPHEDVCPSFQTSWSSCKLVFASADSLPPLQRYPPPQALKSTSTYFWNYPQFVLLLTYLDLCEINFMTLYLTAFTSMKFRLPLLNHFVCRTSKLSNFERNRSIHLVFSCSKKSNIFGHI